VAARRRAVIEKALPRAAWVSIADGETRSRVPGCFHLADERDRVALHPYPALAIRADEQAVVANGIALATTSCPRKTGAMPDGWLASADSSVRCACGGTSLAFLAMPVTSWPRRNISASRREATRPLMPSSAIFMSALPRTFVTHHTAVSRAFQLDARR